MNGLTEILEAGFADFTRAGVDVLPTRPSDEMPAAKEVALTGHENLAAPIRFVEQEIWK